MVRKSYGWGIWKVRRIIAGKILISYFSASGVTKRKAEQLAREVGGDLFEIIPKERYTNEDLDWMNENSRSTKESRDKNYRPEMEDININIDTYDTIFVGFSIWRESHQM